MTMSPSTGPEGISLHAVIFMLRKVESTSDVNRGPEPCQSGTALTSPVLYLAYTRVVSMECGRMRMRMTTIIKPLPVSRVFGDQARRN